MSALDDLKLFGAPVDNPISTARFISRLALRGQEQARLLRGYLSESHWRLTAEVLVAARDYSFYL